MPNSRHSRLAHDRDAPMLQACWARSFVAVQEHRSKLEKIALEDAMNSTLGVKKMLQAGRCFR